MYRLIFPEDRAISGNDIWSGKVGRWDRAEIARNVHVVVKAAVNETVVPVFEYPVLLIFRVYEGKRMRDWSNYQIKAHEDGLVRAGVLPDDNRKYVRGGMILTYVDKDNPRLEVEVWDVVDLAMATLADLMEAKKG